MTRPVALLDIDGTLYNGSLFFEILEVQYDRGMVSRDQRAELIAIFEAYRRGERDYEATISLVLYKHAKMMAGRTSDELLELAKAYCEQHRSQFYTYVPALIDQLRPTHDIALVSGEPQYIARAVGELFGLEYYFSSRYETEENVVTGEVAAQLAYKHEKTQAIAAFLADHPHTGSLAMGDSVGDEAMLGAVEHAICVHSSDELREKALQAGWHVPTDAEILPLVKNLI